MSRLEITTDLVLAILKSDFVLVMKTDDGKMKVITQTAKLPQDVKAKIDKLSIPLEGEFDELKFKWSIGGAADRAAKELWRAIAGDESE